jgi:hypothetical protein
MRNELTEEDRKGAINFNLVMVNFTQRRIDRIFTVTSKRPSTEMVDSRPRSNID